MSSFAVFVALSAIFCTSFISLPREITAPTPGKAFAALTSISVPAAAIFGLSFSKISVTLSASLSVRGPAILATLSKSCSNLLTVSGLFNFSVNFRVSSTTLLAVSVRFSAALDIAWTAAFGSFGSSGTSGWGGGCGSWTLFKPTKLRPTSAPLTRAAFALSPITLRKVFSSSCPWSPPLYDLLLLLLLLFLL